MTHQPYLDWSFSDPTRPDETLTHAERVELQKHLDGCPECSRISEAWRAVEGELKNAPLLTPDAGFTSRWQIHLAADQQHQHHRQGILISAASLGLALALFTLLVFLAWPLLRSPQLLAWTYLYQFVRWVSILSAVQQFTSSLLRAASVALPPIVWVMMIGALALLGGVWVAAYHALTSPRKISTWSETK